MRYRHSSNRYSGNNGLKGAASYKIVGGLYKVTGIRSRWFGILAFPLVLALLGAIIRQIIGLF